MAWGSGGPGPGTQAPGPEPWASGPWPRDPGPRAMGLELHPTGWVGGGMGSPPSGRCDPMVGGGMDQLLVIISLYYFGHLQRLTVFNDYFHCAVSLCGRWTALVLNRLRRLWPPQSLGPLLQSPTEGVMGCVAPGSSLAHGFGSFVPRSIRSFRWAKTSLIFLASTHLERLMRV